MHKVMYMNKIVAAETMDGCLVMVPPPLGSSGRVPAPTLPRS